MDIPSPVTTEPMSLSSALAGLFDNGVRNRGLSYFQRRLVRIRHGSDSEVSATVQGSRAYEVEMRWDGKTLHIWCDCPYFETGENCKHLWAAILAAQDRGCIPHAASARTVAVGPLDEGVDLDEYSEIDDTNPFELSAQPLKPARQT